VPVSVGPDFGYSPAMTNDAEQLLATAIKSVGLRGSFAPVELGTKVGLNEMQATAAARALSNAGILVLGFDGAAQFTPDYRKLRTPPEPKAARKKKARA
jgi:hypothetical protein